MKFCVPLVTIKPYLTTVCELAGSTKRDDQDENPCVNVHLKVENGKLFMRSTDYSVEIQAVCEIDPSSPDYGEGECLIEAVKLKNLIDALNINEDVLFSNQPPEGDDTTMHIKSAATEFTLLTWTGAELPSFTSEEGGISVTLSQGALKELIEKSQFCIANDDFREYLRGMRFEANGTTVSVFSSDSHRMVMQEIEIPQAPTENIGIVLTKRCISFLNRIIEKQNTPVTLLVTPNFIRVACGAYFTTSRLIVCTYPNIRAVLPKLRNYTIAVQRQELQKKVKAVASIARNSNLRVEPLTLKFEPGLLTLSTETMSHEQAVSSMPVEYQGEPVQFTLHAAYLTDVLNNIDTGKALFEFADNLVSCTVRPETISPNGISARFIISRVLV